jgi:hypothetical protein
VELELVSDQFLKYHMKILLEGFSQSRKKDFSNQQSGQRVYVKLVMIWGLE